MSARTRRPIFVPFKRHFLKLFVALAAIGHGGTFAFAQQATDGPPLWAFGYTTPPVPGAAIQPLPPRVLDNVQRLTLPGSKLSFTAAEIQSWFTPADWFPEDHPAMPDVVAHGRELAKPSIRACAFCHMPNGFGRSENSSLAGLPAEYIVQQMVDYKNGLRTPGDPRKPNLMADFAKAMTDEEIKTAAAYFASVPYPSSPDKPWIKVVETAAVPKTLPDGLIFYPVEGAGAGTEPLGSRILEVPVNPDETRRLRNPRSGFIAYVPPGSIAKGQALATTGGGGRFAPCGTCHGNNLQGLGPIPPLAGRSPSSFGRALYDFQTGNRTGAWSPLMASVVADLTPDDIVNLAAYATSLAP